MADLKVLAEQLINLTVKQANELSDILKNDYGIEPVSAAPVMVASASEPSASAAPEKTTFDVMLVSAGASKLGVVKLVKDLTGLPLKEAKDLVESAPVAVKEGLPKDEAETLKSKLEEAGASVELK